MPASRVPCPISTTRTTSAAPPDSRGRRTRAARSPRCCGVMRRRERPESTVIRSGAKPRRVAQALHECVFPVAVRGSVRLPAWRAEHEDGRPDLGSGERRNDAQRQSCGDNPGQAGHRSPHRRRSAHSVVSSARISRNDHALCQRSLTSAGPRRRARCAEGAGHLAGVAGRARTVRPTLPQACATPSRSGEGRRIPDPCRPRAAAARRTRAPCRRASPPRPTRYSPGSSGTNEAACRPAAAGVGRRQHAIRAAGRRAPRRAPAHPGPARTRRCGRRPRSARRCRRRCLPVPSRSPALAPRSRASGRTGARTPRTSDPPAGIIIFQRQLPSPPKTIARPRPKRCTAMSGTTLPVLPCVAASTDAPGRAAPSGAAPPRAGNASPATACLGVGRPEPCHGVPQSFRGDGHLEPVGRRQRRPREPAARGRSAPAAAPVRAWTAPGPAATGRAHRAPAGRRRVRRRSRQAPPVCLVRQRVEVRVRQHDGVVGVQRLARCREASGERGRAAEAART